MTSPSKRWLVRGVKIVFALVIIGFVGWQFHGDLGRLQFGEFEVRWTWLLVSGAFYLGGLAIGAVLIGLCGTPLLPGVFNFLVAKLTARIQAIELYRLPPIRLGTLAVGLLATGASWCVLGLSVWAVLQALVIDDSHPPDLTL